MTTPIDGDALAARLAADPQFNALAHGAHVTFALADPDGILAVVRAGSDAPDEPEFRVVLEPDAWRALSLSRPVPGTQHLLAHVEPRGPGRVEGDRLAFAQHLHLVRRAVELLVEREQATGSIPKLDGIAGRYVRVEVDPWGTCDVYVETAGEGERSLVFLHTAGADSTQYHGLLARAAEFPGFRLIAFDLPWHGRSGPAHGQGPLDYSLTSESYAGCVAAVIAALDLPSPPILVGASMAGAAVLEVAARHPAAISAGIGCQVGPRVGNRHNAWLRSPTVNQALFVPEWTYGLMSPHSPQHDRERVWWGYSRGGYAIYERDITYYTTCWDVDTIAPMLGEHTPPVVLMSGVYDYTVPPAATRELAALIPGAQFREMPELGHFPHAENPSAFAAHLAWAIAALA